MKQFILLFFLLFYLFFPLVGQTNKEVVDLQQQLAKIQDDTTRAILLCKLAWELRRVEPYKVIDSLTNEAVSILKQARNRSDLALGLTKKMQGYLHYTKGEKEKALEYFREAILIFNRSKYFEDVASLYLLQGNLLLRDGQLDASMEAYYTGIRYADTCKVEALKASFYNMIADVKIRQDAFSEAESFLRKAIAIEKKEGAYSRLATAYYNLGSFFSRRNKLDSADVYFNYSGEILESLGEHPRLSFVLSGRGNLAVKRKQFSEALFFYNKSLKIREEIKDSIGIAHSFYQIGNTYFRKEDYQKSQVYIEDCLFVAEKKNDAELKSKAFKKLSQIQERLGDTGEALKHYKRYNNVSQAILNDKTQKAIKEIEEKYENEKLQKENEKQAAAAAKDKIFRNSIIIILVAVLIIALLLARDFQLKRKTADQQKKIYQQEMLQIQQTSELRALNASQDGQEKERKRIAEALHNSMGSLLSAIQMHFQAIAETMSFQEQDNRALFNKSLELIKEAAKTNRGIAHEMMPPILMKFGLGASLASLADKIKSPAINVTTAVYGLEERLPEQIELSLYRIIDELINNILRHARATEVNIQLIEHEDMLNIIVEDNGVGFEYDPRNKAYGVGLSNVMSRINHFNGQFEVDSSPDNGTTIIIDIPKTTYAPHRAKS